MRFLRLDYRDDLRGLDLHPLVTVVSAAEPRQREQLLATIRQLSLGSTSGVRGLLEHDGILLELGPFGGEPLAELMTSAPTVVHLDPVRPGDETSGLVAEVIWAERQAAIDSAVVEEIRSAIDPSVRARIEGLTSRMDPAEPPTPAAMTAGRLRALAVRRAYDAVVGHEPQVPEPAPRLEALIERWEANDRGRTQHQTQLDVLVAREADAERAVVAAAEQATLARAGSGQMRLDAEQETRLEQLNELLNGSSRWRRGLDADERAEMQSLLNRVGASSWTEYSIGRTSQAVAPLQRAAIERAEAELDNARSELEQVRHERSADQTARSLDDELAQLKVDCEPFLGVLVPTDLGRALRQRRRMVDNPDWVDALNDLRDVLASNDLHPAGGHEPADILGWTESWLRAQENIHHPERLPPAPEDTEGILTELEAESVALLRHEQALDRIGRAERNAARSRVRLQQLQGQLRARTEGWKPATAATIMAVVEPLASQILEDVGGSIPLAVVGELAGFPSTEVDSLMERLEDLAQRVQVVIVTDNVQVGAWAGRVGLTRADLRIGAASPHGLVGFGQ